LLKAAVIGAGYIAREHLDALRSLPGVAIEAVCDLSPVMAEATAEEFGANAWFTDHRRMLAEVRPDVVHVTTPPKSHVRLALDALEADAHVLVEKPIALNEEDLGKLASIAREKKLLLLEDYNYLFNPSLLKIRQLIESGEFGEVVHVDAHFCVDILGAGSKHADPSAANPFDGLPGGPVVDFVTHLAYLGQAFVGEAREVSTSWRNRSGDARVPFDEFRALVDAEHGTACLGFSSHAQPDVFSLRVQGTKMRASASLFEPLLVIEKLHGGPRPLLPVWNGLSAASAYTGSAASGLWRKLQGRPGTYEGLWTLLGLLYESLARGTSPPIDLDRIEAVNRWVRQLVAGAEQA
jgi:predicted dehydrogenase